MIETCTSAEVPGVPTVGCGTSAVMDFESPLSIACVAGALVACIVLYVLFFSGKGVFLEPDKFKAAKLIEKESITHNTKRFRFELPRGARLGLPIGQHISFKYADSQGRDVMRSYTPVTGDETSGYVDFVIKVYPEGKMSQHVDKLKINDTLLMRGPKGRFKYSTNMKRSIGMIAGGTGITPMYQVAKEILRNPEDKTQISILFANVSVNDILLKNELDALVRQYPQQVYVHYVLDKAPEQWTGSQGYITADLISSHCPKPSDDCLLLLCGPRPMTTSVEAHASNLGYLKDQVFTF